MISLCYYHNQEFLKIRSFILCLLQRVEVPVPTPKNDEVLLKLEAASINPIDWKIQNGMLRPFLPRKFPFIPGKFNYIGNLYLLFFIL